MHAPVSHPSRFSMTQHTNTHTTHTHTHNAHTPHTTPQAWDLYYHVFKRINKQLHQLTTLELQYVAPALVRAQVRRQGGACRWPLLCFVAWRPRLSGRRRGARGGQGAGQGAGRRGGGCLLLSFAQSHTAIACIAAVSTAACPAILVTSSTAPRPFAPSVPTPNPTPPPDPLPAIQPGHGAGGAGDLHRGGALSHHRGLCATAAGVAPTDPRRSRSRSHGSRTFDPPAPRPRS